MKSIVKTIKVPEAARLLGKPKEYLYGVIQAGVVDFATYHRKEGSTRGTYVIPVGRFAQYLGIPTDEVVKALDEIRSEGK